MALNCRTIIISTSALLATAFSLTTNFISADPEIAAPMMQVKLSQLPLKEIVVDHRDAQMHLHTSPAFPKGRKKSEQEYCVLYKI